MHTTLTLSGLNLVHGAIWSLHEFSWTFQRQSETKTGLKSTMGIFTNIAHSLADPVNLHKLHDDVYEDPKKLSAN